MTSLWNPNFNIDDHFSRWVHPYRGRLSYSIHKREVFQELGQDAVRDFDNWHLKEKERIQQLNQAISSRISGNPCIDTWNKLLTEAKEEDKTRSSSWIKRIRNQDSVEDSVED